MSRLINLINEEKEWYEYGPVDYMAEGDDLGTELTTDDILDAFNDESSGNDEGDDEEQEGDKEKDKEKKTKSDEEDDDEKDDEEEIKIEDEDEEDKVKEEEDVQDLLSPLSRKAVLKKYPNLFKDFPQLEKGYYGNLEYRKAFPTVKEAQEAAAKLEEFTSIEKDLGAGNSESILKRVKEGDEEAFANLVDGYLPTLEKIDERAYYHVVGNVIKRLILGMAGKSREKPEDQDHKDLMTAAQIVKGFMFGDAKIEGVTSYGKQKNPEEDKLKKEREDFDNERLNTRKSEVKDRVGTLINSTLKKHIDPRDAMTDYVKKNAITDAHKKVDDLIEKDTDFQKYLDRMWKAAAKAGYKEENVRQIRDAILSKARTLLPQVIRSIRSEALKGSGKGDRVREKDKVVLRGNKSAARKGGEEDKDEKKDRYKGMSTLDVLNSD